MDKATALELFALLESRGDPCYDEFVPVFTIRIDATGDQYPNGERRFRLRVTDADVETPCNITDWLFALQEADARDVAAKVQNSGVELT